MSTDTETACGEIVGGGYDGKIIIRQKSNEVLELGSLLVGYKTTGNEHSKIFLQVFDLGYGCQVTQASIENVSGLRLEGIGAGMDFLEPNLRAYLLVHARTISHVTADGFHNPKILPEFMGEVRHVNEDDMKLLAKTPDNPLYIGQVRSGSKVLNVDVNLNGVNVLAHHVLIAATTGRGKSNLVKVMLWNLLDKDYCGILVLDAHNEHFGSYGTDPGDHRVVGLSSHLHAREYVKCYSSRRGQIGVYDLKINLRKVVPRHLKGVTGWTEVQEEQMFAAHQQYGSNWISEVIDDSEANGGGGGEDNGTTNSSNKKPRIKMKRATFDVLQRKINELFGVYFDYSENIVKYRNSVFTSYPVEEYDSITEIVNDLEEGKKAIIDTSVLEDKAELVIGSIIANEIFDRHKTAKEKGILGDVPVISIVVEEAARVLASDSIRGAKNIYSDIAREGRKFKVGLIAITQLASMIPRPILANMNTKIILGNELKSERNAIVESASQDLSTENKNIASLDTGEAIITSNFTKFAIPVKVPLFEDVVKCMEGKTFDQLVSRIKAIRKEDAKYFGGAITNKTVKRDKDHTKTGVIT